MTCVTKLGVCAMEGVRGEEPDEPRWGVEIGDKVLVLLGDRTALSVLGYGASWSKNSEAVCRAAIIINITESDIKRHAYHFGGKHLPRICELGWIRPSDGSLYF